jgi:dipeptidyl aminopeptidase/acylaminoacyl peptidase
LPAGTNDLAAIMTKPHVLFENRERGGNFGKVEVVSLDDRTGARAVTPLTCARVAMVGATGVCLTAHKGAILTTYEGEIFDSDFDVVHKFALPGIPSRVRLSPDGKYAAMTSFVTGDSYAQAGFSTRTQFVDTTTGSVLSNLEGFKVSDDGHEVTAVSANYWGVTFEADSDHFYATVGIGTSIQMIEGSVRAQTAHTVRDDVECPALSPDQTRIAYKLRVGGGFSGVRWRLHVVDLQSGHDVALAETRNVDDQATWLDNDTVLYAVPRDPSDPTGSTDTYAVPADGTGAPRKFVPGAWSPSPSVG